MRRFLALILASVAGSSSSASRPRSRVARPRSSSPTTRPAAPPRPSTAALPTPSSSRSSATRTRPPRAAACRCVTESGAEVHLVWLIHDVSPWRIDNVHVVGAGRLGRDLLRPVRRGPLRGVGDLAPAGPWRRPRHEPDHLGVLGEGHLDPGGSTAARGLSHRACRPTRCPSPRRRAPPGRSPSLSPWWVLVGTVLGTLLARRGLRPLHVSRRVEAYGVGDPPASHESNAQRPPDR